MLRTLNGLVKPSRGEVWVAGVELGRASNAELRRVRRSVGMVFQQFNLVGRSTVLENVLVGRSGALPPWRAALGSYSSADKELAWALLERVGLADYAWRRADTLSGGQQQRVGVARALAQEPHLVLADEPVSALDVRSAADVMDLLTEISRGGTPVVANLHLLDAVHRYADWVVALKRGRVVFEGIPTALTAEITEQIYGSYPPTDNEKETLKPALARAPRRSFNV